MVFNFLFDLSAGSRLPAHESSRGQSSVAYSELAIDGGSTGVAAAAVLPAMSTTAAMTAPPAPRLAASPMTRRGVTAAEAAAAGMMNTWRTLIPGAPLIVTSAAAAPAARNLTGSRSPLSPPNFLKIYFEFVHYRYYLLLRPDLSDAIWFRLPRRIIRRPAKRR
jgi:hypothetical protein